MDASLRHLADRRSSIRTSALAEFGIGHLRVRPGHEASLIDISTHGALIETAFRLLPGRHIELQIERGDQLTPVRGRVMRCTVTRVLASRVSYQGGIGFDQPLGWLVAAANHHEYPVLTASAVDRVRR
jgi:PilZ domain-containing protein